MSNSKQTLEVESVPKFYSKEKKNDSKKEGEVFNLPLPQLKKEITVPSVAVQGEVELWRRNPIQTLPEDITPSKELFIAKYSLKWVKSFLGYQTVVLLEYM